jgi:hypothetical protein
MADLLVIAAPLLMLAFLYCGWRATRLLLGWRPAAATVWRGDCGELDQLEDFWIKSDMLTTRGWSPFDGEGQREIEEIVTFEDSEGTSHRAPVRRHVQQGWRPDSVYTIWYDPADPRRATAFGPGSWAVGALLAAAALGWIFARGPELAATLAAATG